MPGTKKRKYRFTPKFLALLFAGFLVFAGFTYLLQEKKLKDIRAEQERYQSELTALKNEEQLLEYMIEYVHSDEYQIQYAREKLGYVLPGDIRFDIGD